MRRLKLLCISANCAAVIATANAKALALPEALSSLRIVATSGQQAPGAPTGTLFLDFDAPVLNNSGATAFRSNVGPLGSVLGEDYGLWFEDGNHLDMGALEGVEPVGIQFDWGGTNFAFNDQGMLVFRGANGIWSASTAGLKPVVQVGDDVPGEQGRTFTALGRPTINKYGTIAFYARVMPARENNSGFPCCAGGIWTANGGIAHSCSVRRRTGAWF